MEKEELRENRATIKERGKKQNLRAESIRILSYRRGDLLSRTEVSGRTRPKILF